MPIRPPYTSDPENTGAMLGLAQMLMEKNPELAWKWCERAYELRPQKINVLKVAGLVAMRAGKIEAASVIHQRLYKLDPGNKTALFNLALTYAQRKMFREFRRQLFIFSTRTQTTLLPAKFLAKHFWTWATSMKRPTFASDGAR